MPPEVPHYRSSVTPLVRFSPSVSPETQLNQLYRHKCWRGETNMNFSAKKLIPFLVLILSIISVLRLVRISITTTSYSLHPLPASPPLGDSCSNSSSSTKFQSKKSSSMSTTALQKKEYQLLSNLISQRSPCNLLIFGLEPEYLSLSSINAGGKTIILEDDGTKISTMTSDSNATRIYKVDYEVPAKEAYNLLKHARETPVCAPSSKQLQVSKCQLALKHLPQEVYELKWDVVVVDGPSGDKLEAPGRMAAIYTASMLARNGNTTDVLVHDVDRTIEKWFSWEFLCDENLVSSKGKLWNFRITDHINSSKFCLAEAVTIV
ncbi:glucuronoxylan 4-O-methyltransferase 1 [Argentina anserina]|uniref:glucuronoxylan 4-O-methyltransferase 1 n=1 Tax=Argentina anserina TaxID=57926 RepID=UPI0021766562|nr:glucuronoxylan 4-O-methyltransferase 1 [Potentilla anserina]